MHSRHISCVRSYIYKTIFFLSVASLVVHCLLLFTEHSSVTGKERKGGAHRPKNGPSNMQQSVVVLTMLLSPLNHGAIILAPICAVGRRLSLA